MLNFYFCIQRNILLYVHQHTKADYQQFYSHNCHNSSVTCSNTSSKQKTFDQKIYIKEFVLTKGYVSVLLQWDPKGTVTVVEARDKSQKCRAPSRSYIFNRFFSGDYGTGIEDFTNNISVTKVLSSRWRLWQIWIKCFMPVRVSKRFAGCVLHRCVSWLKYQRVYFVGGRMFHVRRLEYQPVKFWMGFFATLKEVDVFRK